MAKIKGFKTGKNNREIVAIRFAEDHDLHGLEIDVQKRVPIGVLLGAQSGNLNNALGPLVKRIKRWNLLNEDETEVVPISLEAFGEQFDDSEAGAIIGAWVEAVSGVSAPLGDTSSDSDS